MDPVLDDVIDVVAFEEHEDPDDPGLLREEVDREGH